VVVRSNSTPPDLDLHLIANNYTTHRHPKAQDWLVRHPRFQTHFILTSSSWLNLVEDWFRELFTRRIRRETLCSVKALHDFPDVRNDNPKPFVGTPAVEELLPKIVRVHHALDSSRFQ
jgi:hypothetical protein